MKKLTVVFRDDNPMIHCGDSPSYRTVTIELSDDQIKKMAPRHENESVSKIILDDK